VPCSLRFLTSWLKVGIVFLLSLKNLPEKALRCKAFSPCGDRFPPFGRNEAHTNGDFSIFHKNSQEFL
jgi:hypothetical protein